MVIAQPIGTISNKETCVSETFDNNNIIKKQLWKYMNLKIVTWLDYTNLSWRIFQIFFHIKWIKSHRFSKTWSVFTWALFPFTAILQSRTLSPWMCSTFVLNIEGIYCLEWQYATNSWRSTYDNTYYCEKNIMIQLTFVSLFVVF